MTPTRNAALRVEALSVFLLAVALHGVGGALWLRADEGLPDGDALAVLGAVELFWGRTHETGVLGALRAAFGEDFGEVPPLYYAVTGALSALLRVVDLDGDGPTRIALGWGGLSLLGVAWLGRELGWAAGLGAGADRVGAMSALLLAGSPLWGATQRHLLIEDALCAFTTCTAAAGFAAARSGRLAHWALAGAYAGAALWTKQTALFVLLPLGLVALRGAGWRGPGLAAVIAAGVAAPWYGPRWAAISEYLARSAASNPDAAPWIRQLVFYPAALVQLGFVGAVMGAVAWSGGRAHLRSPGARAVLAVVGLSLLLLLGVPKKYPRLLLGILPLLAAVFALAVADATARRRSVVLGLCALSATTTAALPTGSLPLFGPTEAALVDFDERCLQRWTGPPSRPGLPWDAVIAELEAAGVPGSAYVVGGAPWPAPPCAYETSLHLGEHLRIRMRRRGHEAEVRVSEWARGRQGENPVDLVVSDGPPRCDVDDPELPPCTLRWKELRRIPWSHPDWPLDLRIFRAAPP